MTQESHVKTWSPRSGLPVLTDPIFIGGVPRSGTTVVGKRLLGRHKEVACTVPAEMWFLTDTGGVCDMAARGSNQRWYRKAQVNALRRKRLTPIAAFQERMQGFWYARPWWKDGRDKGLCESISRQDLAASLEIYRERDREDPIRAARLLVADIIDPQIRERGKIRWVDTTPANATRIDALYAVFPDLRLINMIRDGRDVAASIVSRGWGTDDYDRALLQWRDLMIRNHEAAQRIPADRVHHVRLEELVGESAESVYTDMLSFLGLSSTRKMKRFFLNRISPEAGHVGRWRSDVEPDELTRIDQKYAQMIRELGQRGVPLPAGC